MKKTLTAAIAIAATAGLSMAAIETAPAGYAESADTTAAQYVCNPFNSFSGNAPTLGDLDGSALNYGEDKIIIIGADGRKLFTAKYLFSGTENAGWYEDLGEGYGSVSSNSFPLARGTAVQFTGGSSAKLFMAGPLNSADAEPPLRSGYSFVGNASAVTNNLNAVVLGGNYKFQNDYIILDNVKYVYLPTARGSYEAGWYLRDYLLFKKDGASSELQNPALAPGKGFIVYTKAAGATVTISAN